MAQPTLSISHPSKATTSYYSFTLPPFTTATNIGPLTPTSFPKSCYTNLIDMNRDGLGPSGAWKTLGCAISTCCPSSNFYTEEWAWMTSYYSPGSCPSDYQSCSPPTQTGLILTPREGEKIVFCCPNSLSPPSLPSKIITALMREVDCICPNDEDMPSIIPGGCGSRLTKSKEETIYTVMNNFRDQVLETVIPYEFEEGFTQELQIAYPIQIRFPITTTMAQTGATHRGSSGPSLSTGTIIGIAFGGFFSFFTVCSVVYFVLRARKRRGVVAGSPTVPEAGGGLRYSCAERPESMYSPANMEEYTQQSPGYVPRKLVPQAFWNNQVRPPYWFCICEIILPM